MKFPKSIGAAADLLYTLQQQRLAKAREVDELEEQETALEEHILNNMLPALGLSGAKGNIGQVSKKPYDWADVTDWDKFRKYISKTGNWEMIQKRPGITALREVWVSGKAVPGVEKKEGFKLHISKVTKKT